MATDKPVLIAPAMNVKMWEHPGDPAQPRDAQGDGVRVVGPEEGAMACGEFGPGRMSEVPQIVAAIEAALGAGPLSGRHVLVTSGPTHEPIDPVRYIANRSSGRAGHGAGRRAARSGRAGEFRDRPRQRAAARRGRRDRWKPRRDGRRRAPRASRRCRRLRRRGGRLAGGQRQGEKIKKDGTAAARALSFAENPDILARWRRCRRGARTGGGLRRRDRGRGRHATEKRARKGCDWIVANDVSPETGIMGGTENAVTLITDDGGRGLAAVEQGRDGPAAGGAHRRQALA
jgi:phosphopantothenoylcysteine decarboxylase/phosphopantothenate--cysteine ligase